MRDLKEIRAKIKAEFSAKNISLFDADCILSEVLKTPINNLIMLKNITRYNAFKINHYVKKRIKGEPITKMFKKAYFYGYEFYVNKNVLSPRQDTELLVEYCEKNINKNLKILDLCAGSGAIAISLNKLGFKNVVASDISKKALKVAKKNNKLLNTNVTFIKSDMFNEITEKFDVIVSNPPYIESEDVKRLDIEVKKYDPKLALDGGVDGLMFYKHIINNLNKYLNENGLVVLEIGYNQAKDVCNLLKEKGYNSFVIKDYNNLDRVIVGKRS